MFVKKIQAVHLSEGHHARKDDGFHFSIWRWMELDFKLGYQRKGHVLGTQERRHMDKASSAFGTVGRNISRPGYYPTGTLVSSRKQWTEYTWKNKTTWETGYFSCGKRTGGKDDVQSQESSFQRNQEEVGTAIRCCWAGRVQKCRLWKETTGGQREPLEEWCCQSMTPTSGECRNWHPQTHSAHRPVYNTDWQGESSRRQREILLCFKCMWEASIHVQMMSQEVWTVQKRQGAAALLWVNRTGYREASCGPKHGHVCCRPELVFQSQLRMG